MPRDVEELRVLRADHQIEYGKMSLTEEGEQALEICYDDLLDSIEALLSITFAILSNQIGRAHV